MKDNVKYLEEIKYNKALMKRVTNFIRKEREEKEAEEVASKKEASHRSKKGDTTKDVLVRSSNGGQAGLGGSNPLRVLQGISLQLDIYILFFICN
jgi:chemotaxis response regulator CheB